MLLYLILTMALSGPSVSLDQAYILGPLPAPPASVDGGWTGVKIEHIPEIEPHCVFVKEGLSVDLGSGKVVWKKTAHPICEKKGIYWLVTDLVCHGSSMVNFVIAGDQETTLYIDGKEKSLSSSSQEQCSSVFLVRGMYRIAIRVVHPTDELTALHLAVSGDSVDSLTVPGRLGPAQFDRVQEIASASNLAVSSDGSYFARKLTVLNPDSGDRESTVECFNQKGKLVAARLRGTPLFFIKQVLILKGEEKGLFAYDVESKSYRTLLGKDANLGFVKMSPNERWFLFSSDHGISVTKSEDEHRHIHSRQMVSDYLVDSALWLCDMESGARRQLMPPGDYVLDDACFSIDGSTVYYTRCVPVQERPWFKSEVRSIDLRNGVDELLAEYMAGWEVRLLDLLPLPDGKTLLMTGPPEETGEGHAEHNVYNRQLHVLDLNSKLFKRISNPDSGSYDAAHSQGFPRLAGGAVFTTMDDGASVALTKLIPSEGYWREERIQLLGETVENGTLSAGGSVFFYEASSRDEPPFLAVTDLLTGQSHVFERFNQTLEVKWQISPFVDASLKSPKGHLIDAWAYGLEDKHQKQPLVLYFYGGSSPTSCSFNGTHQFFAANGYAVLVVNPRGSYGYGESYADTHAGDWGLASSEDILLVLDHFLSTYPHVDPQRIGIYGGSYGGFMTEYLISISDRFAAACSLYGISDITSYWGDGTWGWTYGDMALGGKTPWKDAAFMVAQSPLYRADRIHTPLLLLHGEDDINVRPEQSIQLFTALKMLKRPVELVLFPGEEHGISGSFANRSKHRTMILEWFDKYLKQETASWNKRWEK